MIVNGEHRVLPEAIVENPQIVDEDRIPAIIGEGQDQETGGDRVQDHVTDDEDLVRVIADLVPDHVTTDDVSADLEVVLVVGLREILRVIAVPESSNVTDRRVVQTSRLIENLLQTITQQPLKQQQRQRNQVNRTTRRRSVCCLRRSDSKRNSNKTLDKLKTKMTTMLILILFHRQEPEEWLAIQLMGITIGDIQLKHVVYLINRSCIVT